MENKTETTEPKYCPTCGGETEHTVRTHQELKVLAARQEVVLNVRSMTCNECGYRSTIKDVQ